MRSRQNNNAPAFLHTPGNTASGTLSQTIYYDGDIITIAGRFLKDLNLWDEALQAGMVDVDPYDPENIKFKGRNLADAGSMGFKMNLWLADRIAAVMATKTAQAWEDELSEARIPAVKIRSFEEWMSEKDTRTALDKLNPNIIAIQLTGHKGERPAARDNHLGYDPALQGATGLMHRFGPEGCPTFHGVASCVDYLCGYLGTWAGMSALFAREQQRNGSVGCPGVTARIGADAPVILKELGYSSEDVQRLIAEGVVGPTEWVPV